jgi:hypothetical protein
VSKNAPTEESSQSSVLYSAIHIPAKLKIPPNIRGNRAAILLLARQQLSEEELQALETTFSRINDEMNQLGKRMPAITSAILTGYDGDPLQRDTHGDEPVAGVTGLESSRRKRVAN